MECPHLSASVCIGPDSARFPGGCPSSWCCSGPGGSSARKLNLAAPILLQNGVIFTEPSFLHP
ncbi:hypothetical protein FKM82_028528 [Ascaphus truei]